MRRRDFVALLGAASLTAPGSALAQSRDRVRRIGMLLASVEGDPDGRARVGAFTQAMTQFGWVEGRNLLIEYRWGGGDPRRAEALAAELVGLAPDVIVANGTPPVASLQRATSTIPIVFVVVTDPVGAGFVQGLARPGANITGFSTFEPAVGGKWLDALREIAPGLRGAACVLAPSFPGFASLWQAIRAHGASTGFPVTSLAFEARTDDIESAVAEYAEAPGGSLIVLPTSVNLIERSRLIALARRYRLPAVYPFRPFAVDGGLLYYGFDPNDLYRRSASYVDRILKGERPADLPVQAPVKFELVINVGTARELGLELSPMLTASADELIE